MHRISFTRTRRHRLVLTALITIAAACGASDGAAAGPSAPLPPGGGTGQPSEKGVVSGRVTDAKGEPIAGATVVINNAVLFNKNIVLKSGNDGRFRFSMPATDSWYVRGTTVVNFNGRTYTFDLHPDYAGAFSGIDGRVVNLQWRTSGEIPRDFGHDGYYGGTVVMDAGWDLDDLSSVTLTLTPIGTLIDGTAGQTITRVVDGTRGSLTLHDVPIGRYRISASRNGAALLIRMRHTSAYVAQVTADFEPDYPGATSYGIYFMVAKAPLGGS